MAFLPRLKSAVRPLYQTTKFVSPTAVGVLLSLGAHAVFFAFAPRTNFSFAALSAVAQQEEAEETIVPIVQLTDAERGRLPAFAQPRVLPPSPTGLSGGLGLPFNLTSPSSSQLQRKPVPANRLPSPTLRTNRPAPTPTFRVPRATTLNPSVFRTLPAPSVTQRPTVSVLPLPTTELPNLSTGNLSINPGTGSPGTQPIPDLSGTQSTPSAEDLQTSPRSIGDALDAAENSSSSDSASSSGSQSPSQTDSPNTQTGVSESEVIAVQPPNPIDVAPAQGDPSRLLDAFIYDSTDVSQEAANANLQAWLVETAENKGEIDTQQATITIDSNFKVCKDNPPTDGLIGVIVNSDGTQESAKVLKSIGYDLLNRQALDAVERNDFGQPATPTQYQVAVEVLYQPAGCVEELPAATEDIDG